MSSRIKLSREFAFERDLSRLAGVDEAGRGPLAGPVVAAAVILDPLRPITGLADSKKLSERQRDALAILIRQQALSFAICAVEPAEIDAINILQASLLAMRRAVQALSIAPSFVQVDGNRLPILAVPSEAIVRGDATEPAISAASILAKTHRDALMKQLDLRYPGYGFAVHKGYPTAGHLAALQRLGVCAIHRRSYAPVKALL